MIAKSVRLLTSDELCENSQNIPQTPCFWLARQPYSGGAYMYSDTLNFPNVTKPGVLIGLRPVIEFEDSDHPSHFVYNGLPFTTLHRGNAALCDIVIGRVSGHDLPEVLHEWFSHIVDAPTLFQVLITETRHRVISVPAISQQAAIDQVETLYTHGQIILDHRDEPIVNITINEEN